MWLYYSVRNQWTDLAELDRQVMTLPGFAELSGDSRYALCLALEELISNIIKYGYDDRAGHEIGVALDFHKGAVRVCLTDDGRAFNPLTEAGPVEIAADVRGQSIGGLGVSLVRALVENLKYRREENRNILEFTIGEAGRR